MPDAKKCSRNARTGNGLLGSFLALSWRFLPGDRRTHRTVVCGCMAWLATGGGSRIS
jgi:hypothetical protein